jgi:hypothetical protein
MNEPGRWRVITNTSGRAVVYFTSATVSLDEDIVILEKRGVKGYDGSADNVDS